MGESSNIARYPHTNIEIRTYGKGELSHALNLSYSSFYRRLKKLESILTSQTDYHSHAKILTPKQIRIFLMEIGYM